MPVVSAVRPLTSGVTMTLCSTVSWFTLERNSRCFQIGLIVQFSTERRLQRSTPLPSLSKGSAKRGTELVRPCPYPFDRPRFFEYGQNLSSHGANNGSCQFIIAQHKYELWSSLSLVTLSIVHWRYQSQISEGIHIHSFRGVQSIACFYLPGHHLRPCPLSQERLTGSS